MVIVGKLERVNLPYLRRPARNLRSDDLRAYWNFWDVRFAECHDSFQLETLEFAYRNVFRYRRHPNPACRHWAGEFQRDDGWHREGVHGRID